MQNCQVFCSGHEARFKEILCFSIKCLMINRKIGLEWVEKKEGWAQEIKKTQSSHRGALHCAQMPHPKDNSRFSFSWKSLNLSKEKNKENSVSDQSADIANNKGVLSRSDWSCVCSLMQNHSPCSRTFRQHRCTDRRNINGNKRTLFTVGRWRHYTKGVFTLASSILNRQNLIFSACQLKNASKDK